ncbi:MAG: glycosyltransferase family 4 protein [Faecalibacterium sp.]|jgi:glycosyltransferase involved in cell wall biosynthesis|nr:glycosyltransferase family 4 protein [Faecalibacterium sp.]
MGKRLLVVTQHFWPENFRVNDLVEGLVADGIEVDVLCGLPNYPKGEWFNGYSANGPWREAWHGAQLYRCREVPRRGNTGKSIFLNYVSWPWYARRTLSRLPGGYDAVLCYNTSPVLMSWPAICAARRFSAPLTNYVLDLWPENLYSVLPVKSRFLRAVAKGTSDWLYRRADRLIALSEGLAARLKARVGTENARGCIEHEKKYAVIPQYCEDFYAVPACDEALARQNAGRFTLLFAGNFSPAQSLETLLQAMALVRQAAGPGRTRADTKCPSEPACTPLPVHLLLVGDGMSRPALEALTDKLHLRDCVTFYGSVAPEAVPALAGACDALVVSLSDSPDLGLTIPAKLASCMACRKPLLVSLSGEGAVAAQASGGAFVSAACDADALAENIVRLAGADTAARAAMGDAAFAYYQAHYRRAALLRQLEVFVLGE